ncbi:hypothetical protein AN191_16370 [Loktanella sp. 5RATIMAR09]|uniref:hypothetical protein n=1 Tax=Loktanella sp. 5RATIMAR09 TaxID=1225655 RepID=UPI0006EBC74F|nr:hypothetical protein [Loktanella sp. 5RATIMAR09]KQI70753.1 hypothetical protein AN191_16370 [Loktanella sp. 5RATIMAR09]
MNIVCRSALVALLATATPVFAQTEEPDMVELVESVTTIATGLSDRVATLGEVIAASTDGDAAAEALNEMLDAARQMQADLGRDSEVWSDINAMLEIWGERRDDLRSRAVDNAALAPIADTWQARIDDALTLRQQILEQSGESQALIDQIEAQREVVIAYYEANLADQALATMRAISDELGQMNDQMSSIVSQAGIVAEPSNLATE